MPPAWSEDGDVRTCLDDPASKAITAKPTIDAEHDRIKTRTATLSTDTGRLEDHH